MKKSEEAFLDLVDKGVYKIYKNGKIYKCKTAAGSNQYKINRYKNCKLKLMNGKIKSGYIQIAFKLNKKRFCIYAHRALWLYFNGEIPKGLEINHKKGIKDDNRLSKLELVTRSENSNHAYNVLGRIPTHGENSGRHKLTNKKVLEIRKMITQGIFQYKIAKIFDVDQTTIACINTGKTWAWLT